MNCPVFALLLLLHTGFASLPAPVNISVDSVNFHHVLRWDPGPGTPPGTQYQVCRVKVQKTKKLENLKTTKETSVTLRLKKYMEQYVLAVRAFYNQTLFSEYRKHTFTPYRDTKIGPPTLSLAGCGNCINVNVSLPKPAVNAGITDLHSAFGPNYSVSYKKRDGKLSHLQEKPEKTERFTLSNLERGTEYCVQVDPKINVNKHTQPSAWECVFTSAPEPNRGPVVLGAVIAPLVFVFGALMTIMLLLYYTGFICKLKATLPRVLNAALSRSYTLTPEKTILDHIHISPDVEKQKKHNNPTMPQPARGPNLQEEDEEEDEEEDDEGMNIYVNRPAGLSSGQTSCEDSGDMAGNQTLAASGNSGSLTVKEEEEEEEEAQVAEFEDTHDEYKAKNDVTELSLIPLNPGCQTGVQSRVVDEVVEEKMGQEEEMKKKEEEQGSSSGNVNLFSVTLGALASCEEEEEYETRDSLTDFLKLCDQEPLLPTNSESEDQTDVQTAALMLQTHADFTDSGYESKHADPFSNCEKPDEEEEEEEDEDEDEDEEEFSGYMKHT